MLPLGISFFTFKAISYLADVYTGRAELSDNPLRDALYLSFFAQIQMGPLVRYEDMSGVGFGSINREARMAFFSDGVFRFLVGFNKKVLLADTLANVTDEIFSASFDSFTAGYAWLGALCYALQIFFDFSGYVDMSIGISEMFGYRCPENFNYPYMTKSVSEFWRRWHISLSTWFRDYVYIPLGGSRGRGKCRVCINLLIVWLLTGLWHGADLNFLVWGLGYFVLIAFEKLSGMPDRLRTGAAKIAYRIFTVLFVVFQWVLFRSDSLYSGLRYIKRMLVNHADALTKLRTSFLFRDYFAFILTAVVLCFPIVPWLGRKLEGRRAAHMLYEAVIAMAVAGLFIWAVALVVSGQNNPFIYANF